jgi:CubicO group peptidase (beta-lactamase class C family)
VICQLAEQGVLKLDDPVQTHFPEIKRLANAPANSKPITFRMLANHTSGLVREPKFAQITARGPISLWENKVLQAIPNTSFKTKPLTEFSYSNIGYAMLGLAGSRAADKPFMLLVEKQIFEPLEMNNSTFIVEKAEMKQRLAIGYLRDRKTGSLNPEVPTRQHAGRGYKVPNGGIYSTVGDMEKFAAAMMGETKTEILTAQMRKRMFTPQLPAERYGLGFKITEAKGLKVVGHSGSVAGYRADLRFELNSKWGVATLATTQYSPPVAKLFIDLVTVVEESQK